MGQKSLATWLKCILIGIGICGLVIYLLVIPAVANDIQPTFSYYSKRFWTWLTFIWISGIPCYAVLVISWKIVSNIGNNRSFSESNANHFKWISVVSAADTVFLFIGNVILYLLHMINLSIVFASVIIVFIGVAVAVITAALSHLVKKAALLQEQSDLTI